MACNDVKNVNRARALRDDEFYTPYSVVKKELDNYTTQFSGKSIICPCDFPKELIPIMKYKSITKVRNRGLIPSYGDIYEVDLYETDRELLEKTSTLTGNFIKYLVLNSERLNISSLYFSGMSGVDGLDFRSINYSNYDIVVTNPPFTLMGEFVDLIVNRYKKDILILSSQLAVTLAPIIGNFISNTLKFGYTTRIDSLYYEKLGREVSSMEMEGNTVACCGFMTTLDVPQPDPWPLVDRDISTYESVGKAIYIERTKDIPDNYFGPMIVPVTFIHKYNSDQFSILGLSSFKRENGSNSFARLIIKRNS